MDTQNCLYVTRELSLLEEPSPRMLLREVAFNAALILSLHGKTDAPNDQAEVGSTIPKLPNATVHPPTKMNLKLVETCAVRVGTDTKIDLAIHPIKDFSDAIIDCPTVCYQTTPSTLVF